MAKTDTADAPEGEAKTTKAKTPKPMNECECGCGGLTKRRFLPGHDAKLKSALIRAVIDDGDKAAEKRLADLGWTAHLEASRAKAERLAASRADREAKREAARARREEAQAKQAAKATKKAPAKKAAGSSKRATRTRGRS